MMSVKIKKIVVFLFFLFLPSCPVPEPVTILKQTVSTPHSVLLDNARLQPKIEI